MIRVEVSGLEKISDSMTTFTLCDNQFRCAFFSATRFVSQMRAQHGLGILESLCLGTGALCASLLIPTMKGHERAVLNYETDGAIPGFSVEACSEGWVRGYLFEKNISLSSELTSWDLAPLFGKGFLSVSKFKENAKEPSVGSIAIQHKNIAQDMTEYFLQSEQTNTAIKTGIKFNRVGEIQAAGAFFVQVLPDAQEENIEKVEAVFSTLPSPAELVLEFPENSKLIESVFVGLEPMVLLHRDIQFFCPCSREGFLEKLKLFSKEDIDSLEDPVEILCSNCSSRYVYAKGEVTNGLA